jgi:hypothetical protein
MRITALELAELFHTTPARMRRILRELGVKPKPVESTWPNYPRGMYYWHIGDPELLQVIRSVHLHTQQEGGD